MLLVSDKLEGKKMPSRDLAYTRGGQQNQTACCKDEPQLRGRSLGRDPNLSTLHHAAVRYIS